MTPHIAATDIDINMNSIHESESFKTHNPNAIITTVDNDDMRPIFKPGDLLGAIHVDSLPEQQELYMLSTSEATMIRLAKYSPKQNIIVTATYNSLTIGAINVNDILDCYRVIWWRSFI
ncbi:hypothetical protein AVI48_15500 (plasmid) [Piscirickettsia salmonis]|nr:hypothetical protein AVI48_15500 [Piscirickettsia salmonis]APS49280.1 hypothetical protein AVI49_16625 [Piscirickettsia salmonis]